MKMKIISAVAILACVATGVGATLSTRLFQRPADTKISGDYVEARTASVFCGACHFNGELDILGRDAVMAWSFTGGSFNGVDLTGVRAVAAVTSDKNLIEADAPHRTELAVDSSASEAQASAVTALLRAKLGAELGEIAAVRRVPVMFTHGEMGYTVDAAGFATLAVDYRADAACCIQPNLVWYEPLSPIEHRKVGLTQNASFSGAIAAPWTRHGEDSAMYGAIAF